MDSTTFLTLLYPHTLTAAGDTPSYSESVLDTTPIAFWRFNEASGTVATDQSGNGRHGTYTANIVLAQSGVASGERAIRVNGAAAVQVSGIASAFSRPSGTVSFFFKPTTSGVLTDATVRYLFYTNINAQNTFYFRRQAANNTFAAVYAGQNTTKSITITSSSSDWTHVAVTWASGGILSGYLQGVPVSQSSLGLVPLVPTSGFTALLFGASSLAGASPWAGYLQDAVIHNSVQVSADIALMARCSGHVVFDGDSRTISSSFAIAYPTVCMAASGVAAKRYGFYNSGVSGQTIAQFNADAATEVDAQYRSQFNNIAVVWGGVNDANAGASVQTIYDRLVTWCRARQRAGFKVLVCTEIDAQDAGRNSVGWHSTMYPALNTLIRTNYGSFADGIIDLGAVPELQNALNTVYFNADAVHPNATGYAVIGATAAAVIIQFM
jgi:lysophospholipase L1-like esterase